jgi:hypothetical protein
VRQHKSAFARALAERSKDRSSGLPWTPPPEPEPEPEPKPVEDMTDAELETAIRKASEELHEAQQAELRAYQEDSPAGVPRSGPTLAGVLRERGIKPRGELLELLRTSHAGESKKVAESARVALDDLLRVYAVEDSARELVRTFPEPQPEQVGDLPGQPLTTIWGPLTTQHVSGTTPHRGDLESALRYLISLGSETVIGDASDGNAA